MGNLLFSTQVLKQFDVFFFYFSRGSLSYFPKTTFTEGLSQHGADNLYAEISGCIMNVQLSGNGCEGVACAITREALDDLPEKKFRR